jgi:hypothetical protein
LGSWRTSRSTIDGGVTRSSRVEADGKLTLVQTSDSAKGDKPETVRFAAEPGLYVLEVRDAKNREANFQDSYQLGLDEGEE